MRRKIKLFGLVAACSAMIMVSACEIGESPIEIARKHRDHMEKPPVQTIQPAVANQPAISNQPTAPEQAMPAESAPPSESVKPEELGRPLREESLAQIKAWAVVDEDKSPLRAALDVNAKVVQELPFATVLFVLGEEPHQEEINGKTAETIWYKVALTDKKTWGWISDRYVHATGMSPAQFTLDDLADFYYAASTTMEDTAKRTRLLNLLIEQYPKSNIYFKDPDTQIVMQGNAKELALFALADIYRRERAYQKAIEAYGTIIDEARRSEVKGYAEWNLLKIYKNNLRDTKKTIDQALHIIDAYEKVGISGYQWNIWVDIEAAEVLHDTLISTGAAGTALIKYGETVIGTSNYPPVQVMGSIILAQGYGKQNDPAAVKNTILAILKQHPSTPVQYYKRTVDYSTRALSFAVKYYVEERHDYSAALAFAREAAAITPNNTLANNAKFAIAYISDIGHFNREDVIAAYQACENVRNYLYKSAFASSDERIKAIQSFAPFSGIVVSDRAQVWLDPDASSAVVFSLAKGDKVTALYGNPPNFQGTWLKVKTQDNRFGWIQADVLDKNAPSNQGEEADR